MNTRIRIAVPVASLVSLVLLWALSGCSCGSDNDRGGNGDGGANATAEGGTGTGSADGGTGTGTGDGSVLGSNAAANFPGAGTGVAGDPLIPGVGPETARECGSGTPSPGTTSDVKDHSIECFFGGGALQTPAAAIEQIVEVIDDVEYVHLRLTLDPSFVDNSYGTNALGWEGSKKGEHKFKDLTGSDHAEILLYDADGTVVLHFKVDYISEDKDDEYDFDFGTMGVTGGDGKVEEGDAEWVLGVATSMDRNFNGCGFDSFTEDSPRTDADYTPDPAAAQWDFRVVYEVWIDGAAFGDAGYGKAIIENVHASPSKQQDNTIEVVPGDCPDCDPTVEVCDPWTPPDTDGGLDGGFGIGWDGSVE